MNQALQSLFFSMCRERELERWDLFPSGKRWQDTSFIVGEEDGYILCLIIMHTVASVTGPPSPLCVMSRSNFK